MSSAANGHAGNGRKGPSRDNDKPATEFGPEVTGPDLPLDDAPADGRGMLSKLALSLMGCRPELSMAREREVTMNGTTAKVKAGEQVLQALLFGHITGLTGPKELPNAKSEADKITYGLKGNIEGINVLTGEMFKAAVLYLPGGFHDMFLAEMEAGLQGGDANTQIAFSLEFWSIPSDNPRGYSWKAVNKMPMQKHDPLARLRQRALQGVTIKALPAPAEKVVPESDGQKVWEKPAAPAA